MLIGLNVKNLALIKEAEVMFGEGLNIITGETGAGKSLVIGSVNLALGKRADKDIVRNGEREAEVELVFSIDDEDTKSRLEELEIPVSDDGLVILRRTIRDGRSVAKINSRTVTASALKSVSELLIDIHGQHEHQSLLYKRNHMRILDNFGSARLSDGLMRIKKDYLRLQEIKRELEDVPIDERQRTRQIDLLKYEIDEIEKAAFKEGEDEELEEIYIKLKNAGRITSGVAGALSAVSGDGMNNAVSLIGEAVSSLKEIEGLDGGADALLGQISEIESLIGDFSIDANDFIRSMDFSEEEFSTTEKRLDLINHLKSKYGDSFAAITESLEEKKKELYRLQDIDSLREKLFAEKDVLEERLLKNCREVSLIRAEEAEKLSQLMCEALKDLNFNEVNFRIDVRPDENNAGERGFDDVEFMISMNKGEPLKSLENVASGGELSRIMLALRTVLADEDDIDTLIFDEIDTGVSGRTAQSVAEKLKTLSKKHQVICITHLPQIAAMADHHFMIEKQSDDEMTQTKVYEIEGEAITEELSRLLSGAEITDAVRQNARELKKMAAEFV